MTTHLPSADKEGTLRLIGMNVGRTIAQRLSNGLPPFIESKDAVKFICKDLWFSLFRQQASRLQASKRGVYIIHDSNFPRLHTISKCVQNYNSHLDDGGAPDVSPGDSVEANERSNPVKSFAISQMQMTAGTIEGFLDAFGFKASVDCMLSAQLPACSFQVSILECRNILSAHSSPGIRSQNPQESAEI